MHGTTFTSGKVLLIDDDDIDAARTTRWIRQFGNADLEVLRVSRLSEAVRVLKSFQPIVIMIDLELPDAHGIDCIHTLLEYSPTCPIIVQTDIDNAETPIAALELGAQDYLVKGKLDRELLERSLRHSLARHQTLLELTQRTNELHEIDAEFDDFTHVVAHDLRAPVRTARLFATRLVHSIGDSNSLAIEFGERLDECLGRVDSMIVSMLDYSALRQEFPATVSLDLHQQVRGALDFVSADVLNAALLNGAVSTTVDIDGDLRVLAESDLFGRVLVNILTNSLRYRAPDRPLHIGVSAERVDMMVRLSITDNGNGMPAEATERVFRILERLEPGATSGLGFGLPICRRIIDGFDGSIWIEPAELVGTTVHIELPAG